MNEHTSYATYAQRDELEQSIIGKLDLEPVRGVSLYEEEGMGVESETPGWAVALLMGITAAAALVVVLAVLVFR